MQSRPFCCREAAGQAVHSAYRPARAHRLHRSRASSAAVAVQARSGDAPVLRTGAAASSRSSSASRWALYPEPTFLRELQIGDSSESLVW